MFEAYCLLCVCFKRVFHIIIYCICSVSSKEDVSGGPRNDAVMCDLK